ncbi:3-dehydroquinate synthase [bacterium]|nr:MAG: 3-dehydroquinate synthase [bacterium]
MTVPVSLGERSYSIHIEAGALQTLAGLPAAAFSGEVALISNATLAPIVTDGIARQLEERGQRVVRFDMGDGERYKTLDTASLAFDTLAEAGFSRRGAVWAVGGGVTGDLAGYVAATWMRGVSFVQVPTTLLAMVDSSVGGKTGVNHPRAKNLLGAFWQPVGVLIDPTCLQTLPKRELGAGLAEVIKYGVIADAKFFGWLEENLDAILGGDAEATAYAIQRSCEVKAEVVGQDERESDSVGRRATLNYGHTFGHSLEALKAGDERGSFLHGEAISVGMTVEAQLGIELGTIGRAEGEELIERQTRLFERAGLPTRTPDLNFEAAWRAMTLDKKNRGAEVNFIVPKTLGEVVRVQAGEDTVRVAMSK